MPIRASFRIAAGVAGTLLALAHSAHAQPLGTAFTYQGRLMDAAAPANGAYDLQVILYDAAVGGSQVGPILVLEDVVVDTGLFTVPLDFGASFGGSRRWLDIGVRPGASSGIFTPLVPRQELTPAPLALYSAATPWTGVSAKPPGFADDIDNDLLVELPCGSGQVPKWNGSAWVCASDADSGGTVTSVASGTGLNGGPITGSGTLSVAFSGSGSAGTVARSDHDHLGQSWSGASASGLDVATTASAGTGLSGSATGGTGLTTGVRGQAVSTAGRGVFGTALATTGEAHGVEGQSTSTSGTGVYGLATSSVGISRGVYGQSQSTQGVGVRGYVTATTGSTIGVRASSDSTFGYGLYASTNAIVGTNFAIFGQAAATSAYAGYFSGRVTVAGVLTKSAGSFKIDHPLDPRHKYLYHSFVESPDMKNIYDGVIRSDADGFALVTLPDWFEALNRDFRYQLTVLGDGVWARARVFRKMEDRSFVIQTDQPWVEVSWQVTGIRRDAYAESHRIPVEEDKPEDEQGTYLHPAEFGAPLELGIDQRRARLLAEEKP